MVNSTKSYFPIVYNLDQKNILFVGAGKVALRKLKALQNRNIKIKAVSPSIHSTFHKILKKQKGKFEQRSFKTTDLKNQDIVFIMTNDQKLNEEIAILCQKRQILYNVATGSNQSFLMTSFFERADMLIAISTRGAAPFLAKAVRRNLELVFDRSWISKVKKFANLRTKLLKSGKIKELKNLSQKLWKEQGL